MPLTEEQIMFRVGNHDFTLENLSESDEHLHWVIDQHRPTDGKSFCPVCDLRAPCDMVSLAASGLARSVALRASQAEARRLREALAWYGEPRNYRVSSAASVNKIAWWPVVRDAGARARATLAPAREGT